MVTPSFVLKVIMTETKTCKTCRTEKLFSDFYCYNGYYRRECKKCSSKRVYREWKKKNESRPADPDYSKAYMKTYRKNNKEKIAECYANFLKRNPDYHKSYYRLRRDKGIIKRTH